MGLHKERVAILGCGVLGREIAKGLQSTEAGDAFEVAATQRTPERAREVADALGIPCDTDNRGACARASIVILAVRPQAMADLLREIAPVLSPPTLCVSIAAGLPLRFYEELLPTGVAVIRAHPSPMVTVRRGFIALSAGTHAGREEMARARRLFAPLCGDTLILPERDINLFAALFGSSSALLYLFVDAILAVNARASNPSFSPRQVIAGMLDGAARMLVELDKSPRQLSEEICTPGGMTIEGVKVWEQNHLSQLVTLAMETILQRVEEMGRDRV
jgi:pyrroline-5-carboxylate reductase